MLIGDTPLLASRSPTKKNIVDSWSILPTQICMVPTYLLIYESVSDKISKCSLTYTRRKSLPGNKENHSEGHSVWQLSLLCAWLPGAVSFHCGTQRRIWNWCWRCVMLSSLQYLFKNLSFCRYLGYYGSIFLVWLELLEHNSVSTQVLSFSLSKAAEIGQVVHFDTSNWSLMPEYCLHTCLINDSRFDPCLNSISN